MIEVARPVLRPDFAFLDVESSCLWSGFPVEVGWCFDDLAGESLLVKPSGRWGWCGWCDASERLHGISIDRLMDEGIEVEAVARRMNEALSGRTAFTDDKDFDGGWIEMLFAAAGVERRFGLADASTAIGLHVAVTGDDEDLWEVKLAGALAVADRAYPHVHRALPDARRMAAIFRMTVDEAFRPSTAPEAVS